MRPKLKPKTLPDVFAAYRACQKLLARDIIPHPVPAAPLPGYEEAVDPDLIHVGRVHAPAPAGYGVGMSFMSRQEWDWSDYVEWVDGRVGRLPALQRDIVRVRYMGVAELSGQDAYYVLRAVGVVQTFEEYFVQIRAAQRALRRAFKINSEHV
ncbi:hypothetical protein [Alicyclobacillus sp. ALC3]|uniref:hypothetical protein n=1 Tax=Alicyclobacillus sp. ALC3 TaxID=2796143 RepID=UPI002378A8AB|nr:hypothetical protein [Alicyclobacillus sp. ALC3]WDL96923.1 hypothetical protein JC200_22035 [Alicyclobacillus sp. ALC3]